MRRLADSVRFLARISDFWFSSKKSSLAKIFNAKSLHWVFFSYFRFLAAYFGPTCSLQSRNEDYFLFFITIIKYSRKVVSHLIADNHHGLASKIHPPVPLSKQKAIIKLPAHLSDWKTRPILSVFHLYVVSCEGQCCLSEQHPWRQYCGLHGNVEKCHFVQKTPAFPSKHDGDTVSYHFERIREL